MIGLPVIGNGFARRTEMNTKKLKKLMRLDGIVFKCQPKRRVRFQQRLVGYSKG